ncbi:MAG: serine/threonine protein kinase [Candidatus Obscuribacterales bacterium]|nr:serine/threonine protein kinase [Candidatus Obscuribacterales bacterium]
MKTGDLIKGRFRVKAKLGEGGMGQVFKGWDELLNRDVAIKVLYPNTSDHLIARFIVEGKALGQVQHANIMGIHDIDQADNGQLFMVMDFIKGESLSTMIEKRGPQTFFDVLPIFEKICFGLRHAHSKNILHRDIKPSNVMLADDRRKPDSVKLVDFGLAKQMTGDQELTKTGSAMGSPPYMSPEAVHGKDVDERSDIYSLGCLFFEMLAARPPFIGDTQFHTMMAHIHKLAPSISEVTEKTYDDEVEEFVRKCMAKDPANRFQNMEEVVSQLEQIVTTLTERYKAERDSESSVYASGAQARLKNEKITKVLALVSIVILVLGGIAIVYFATREPEKVVVKEELLGLPLGENDERKYLDGAHKFEREDGRAACRVAGTLDPEQISLDVKTFKDIEFLFINSVEQPKLLVPFLELHYKWLEITETPINAELWGGISKNKDIGFLVLNSVGGLTEEAVACMKSLPKLIFIKVVGTEKIDNINVISEIRTIQTICLDKFVVPADTMRDFVSLPRLFEVNMNQCKIAPGALLQLNNCPCVKLTVSNAVLTDSQLSELPKLSKLIFLDLHRTNLDDDSFLKLAAIKALKTLIVDRTGVTPKAVAKMHTIRPDIQFKL